MALAFAFKSPSSSNNVAPLLSLCLCLWKTATLMYLFFFIVLLIGVDFTYCFLYSCVVLNKYLFPYDLSLLVVNNIDVCLSPKSKAPASTRSWSSEPQPRTYYHSFQLQAIVLELQLVLEEFL